MERDRGIGPTGYRSNLFFGEWLEFRFTLVPPPFTPFISAAGCVLELCVSQLCRGRKHQVRGTGVILEDFDFEVVGNRNVESLTQN